MLSILHCCVRLSLGWDITTFCLLSVVLICPRLSLKNHSQLAIDRSYYKAVQYPQQEFLFLIWTRKQVLHFLKTLASNWIFGLDAIQIWPQVQVCLPALLSLQWLLWP